MHGGARMLFGLPVVLIVGDRQESLAIYALGLLAMGFHPVVAGTAEEAFERASRVRPHAVVADLMLPRTSAARLFRQLRGDTRTSDAAIVVLSDAPSPSTNQELASAGCDRVLRKPISPDSLADESRARERWLRSRVAKTHLTRQPRRRLARCAQVAPPAGDRSIARGPTASPALARRARVGSRIALSCVS